MLELPSPLGVKKELCERIAKALLTIATRPVTHLVEQNFLDCHSVQEMRELQLGKNGLPLELQREDRRQLDLLIFELLGVSDPKRREDLVNELYRLSVVELRGF
jgi:hypothetical protein